MYFFIFFQARFQAQQLMEREEKLINILEERQEEAIRRIAYNNRDSVHSANSLSSTNSNSASSYNSQNAGRGGPAGGPGKDYYIDGQNIQLIFLEKNTLGWIFLDHDLLESCKIHMTSNEGPNFILSSLEICH